MQKLRFVIVGSGWRSLYYARIARALPDRFELCAMLCRTEEKAARMAAEYGIPAVTCEQACIDLRPDVVVIAVSKASLAEVSAVWLQRGFTVLCETPAAMDVPALERLWALQQSGCRLVIAEQYTRYPVIQAMLAALDTGLIGQRQCLTLSLAHEYHAASLARAFLGLQPGTPFTVSARTFTYPTARTFSRYERFTDRALKPSARTAAVFAFAGGQTLLYDFDSEQYRSPIRPSAVRLQGSLGYMDTDVFRWLDADGAPHTDTLRIDAMPVHTGDPNPNLADYEEIRSVSLGSRTLYTPPFGLCGLSQDETAIAQLLAAAGAYARGEADAPYPLAGALEDAYAAILLRHAAATGETLSSARHPWHP